MKKKKRLNNKLKHRQQAGVFRRKDFHLMELPKIVVIVGPTASGKTDLGIYLAKKFNGEVVSADSRQVYRQMSIGTAKPDGKWKKVHRVEAYFIDEVAHHMIDIVDPGDNFSMADYKNGAVVSIQNILKRKKIPILVGGTGLYIWTIVDNLDIPGVEPKLKMRKMFEKKSHEELIQLLIKVDPESAEKIDLKNSRRVIRALEVFTFTGESFVKQRTKSKPLFDALQIGIDIPKDDLNKRIETRVDKQIANGLIEETKKLGKKYGWKLLSMSGIGYKQIGCYLRGEMELGEAIDMLKRDTRHYAKRQMTWFKRDKRINWVSSPKEAEKLVEKFI